MTDHLDLTDPAIRAMTERTHVPVEEPIPYRRLGCSCREELLPGDRFSLHQLDAYERRFPVRCEHDREVWPCATITALRERASAIQARNEAKPLQYPAP